MIPRNLLEAATLSAPERWQFRQKARREVIEDSGYVVVIYIHENGKILVDSITKHDS